MASYIDTYIALCYTCNLDDIKTISAMGSIIKTLNDHKLCAIGTARIVMKKLRDGELVDAHQLAVADIVGEINAAINMYSYRLKHKQRSY